MGMKRGGGDEEWMEAEGEEKTSEEERPTRYMHVERGVAEKVARRPYLRRVTWSGVWARPTTE